MRLGILTLNVANPSAARAQRQLTWLADRPEQVLVLSETGAGAGTRLLFERLAGVGWEVRGTPAEERERGVAIATRLRCAPPGEPVVVFLPGRAERLDLPGLDVIGLYVPSRDESELKLERKRRFCGALSEFLAARPLRDAVVIGDLNVLEPAHRPHYPSFRDWEYRLYDEFLVRGFVDAYRLRQPQGPDHSWVDYEGRGYRFDHAFVTGTLAPLVRRCEYVHETREDGLSDHSALALELDWPHPLEELDTVGSLAQETLALF